MDKTVYVTSKNKQPLNELTDYVLENALDSVARLEVFELTVGATALLGGGEPPVTRIKIVAKIDNPQSEIEDDLALILSLLEKRATDLSIEIEFE